MENLNAKEVKEIVIRFSGDSGDGMQLTGTLFSNTSALEGNGISTFPTTPPRFAHRRVRWLVYRVFRYTLAQVR